MKELEGDPKKAQEIQVYTYEHFLRHVNSFHQLPRDWNLSPAHPQIKNHCNRYLQSLRSSDLIGLEDIRDGYDSKVGD